MKVTKLRLFSLLISVIFIALWMPQNALCSDKAHIYHKVSSPFQYSGYSFPEYTSYSRSSEFVDMLDGTPLAVDVYLPSGGPSDGPFPVLLIYYPYRRALIDPITGNITIGYMPGMDKEIMRLTSYGYAIVIADMRGSGASYGVKEIDMGPQLALDGKELVDWIEIQPWCDGNVGMFGGSYWGWSQYAVAGQKPSALKCIMPEIMGFDMYSDGMFRPGGIYNAGLVGYMAVAMSMMELGTYIPPGFLPVAPVIDEDKDGKFFDEIPLYPTGKNVFVYDPPTYSDGETRDDIYYNAIVEHTSNLNFANWVPNTNYRDELISGTEYTFADLGPSYWPMNIAESGIAIYNLGGWFDIFTRGTTRWYATMRATNPSKMLIHPSVHSIPDIDPNRVGPYWKFFGLDAQALGDGLFKEKLRFFDHYLKGIRNGIDKESPIYIYVMNGEGWRAEDKWPLARQITTNYYFGADNTLSKFKSSHGSTDYQSDFTHSSRYGTNNGTRWIPGAGSAPNEVMIRTEKDKQCLTFTSKPLEKDTEITGHPIVHMYVSSTAADGDFFVYFEDVDSAGTAYYVTEGMLRAGFARLVPQEDMLPAGSEIDVKPDLPYHGFKAADYDEDVFAKGKVKELVIDLFPTSWVFKKGHRYRVSIASADYPTFQLNPKLSPNNKPVDDGNTVPTVTIHHGKKHLSRIELPVVPPKPRHPKERHECGEHN